MEPMNKTSLKNFVHKSGRTTAQFNEFKYTWVLENFLYFKARKCGVCTTSPTFTVYNNQHKYEWLLKLFPNGNDEQTKGLMGVHLERVSSPAESKETIIIKLTLLSTDGKQVTVADKPRGIICPEKNIVLTFNKSWDDLRQRFIFANGELTISCSMVFDNGDHHVEVDSETISISEFDCQELLIDDLEAMLTSPRFSDVKLLVTGKEFQAHKVILAARSPVFLAMLESNMKEGQDSVIEVGDIEPDVMAELLRFIYTGKVENMDELVADLLAAADMYQLDHLRIMCEAIIAKKLSIDNVAEILKIVDRHVTCKNLRESVFKFLACNGKDVAGLKKFDEILRSLSTTLVIEVTKAVMLKS
ncbi:hypothetical protein TSAR_013059 [Trichomalopsis sarcophagae]|uniref:BTB domain-containing protein n=1 Tax=Trichomalopsis sarcophagae TaxID=543379 RepID=A0A232EPG3_9HYME|nr:hypothetical protein TSAR_013059 [Trichomalopsis sarcophagae]